MSTSYLITLYNRQSSANNNCSVEETLSVSAISLTSIKNIEVLKTVPWGTADLNEVEYEDSPSTTTRWILCVSHVSIHLWI